MFNLWRTHNTSWIWQGIINTREVLNKGICYLLGNGSNIEAFDDPWGVQGHMVIHMEGPRASGNQERVKVADLFDMQGREWKSETIEFLFDEGNALVIVNMSLLHEDKEDSGKWTLNASGEFSVASAYRALKNCNITANPNWQDAD